MAQPAARNAATTNGVATTLSTTGRDPVTEITHLVYRTPGSATRQDRRAAVVCQVLIQHCSLVRISSVTTLYKRLAAGTEPNADPLPPPGAGPFSRTTWRTLMAATTTAAGAIVGYFDDNAEAEQAISELREAGFTSAHLGVAHHHGSQVDAPDAATGASAAHAGEAAGGVWDKVKSFFGGDPVEPYSDEHTQGAFANREVTSNPAARYGSSDVHGTLSGLDVPDEHARYFAHRLSGSDEGAVVTINAGSAPLRHGPSSHATVPISAIPPPPTTTPIPRSTPTPPTGSSSWVRCCGCRRIASAAARLSSGKR